MAVLFISEETIKNSTTINGNVDAELLLPYIKVSQDIHVQQLLGTDLYDVLQDKIAGTGGASLAGNYKILVDEYIQPVLIHYSLYECVPFLSYKIMNKDIVRKISETSTPASLEDIKYMRNIIVNTAQFYAERLVEYLKNNTSLFPEFSTNSGADMSPSNEAYFNGMNLEGLQQSTRITLRDFLTPDIS